MTVRVIVATRNRGKLAELHRIVAAEFEDAPVAVTLTGLDDLPGAPDVPETELTFEGNALLKARAIAAFSGSPSIADDSGLCVDALNGMPGVLSARWSGTLGGPGNRDETNVRLLLDQLADIQSRGAHFICAAAIAFPDGREHVVTGRLDGVIIREPRGTGGFGYDPIFQPDGEDRTIAELPSAEKDAISHRGRALRALAPDLKKLIASSP